MAGARIGVVGATGLLGSEVLKVLDGAPWRPDEVVAVARLASTTPFVSYGEVQVAVDDLDSLDVDGLDALVVAVPRGVAADVVARAGAAGVPVVDASGSQLDQLDVPLVLPFVDRSALNEARARDVVAVPSAAGALLASVLAPLARAGWSDGVEATVLVPASTFGRDAVEELSRQVVALFNAGTPPRKRFPAGLAFDVLPLVGETGATGWSGEELRVVAEVARLTGVRAQVSMAVVPVFTGTSAQIRFAAPPDVSPEGVAAVLSEAGIEVAAHTDPHRLPRPRRMDGEPVPAVARVRRGTDGAAVHLWAAVDGVRAVAAAAVALTGALLGQRADDEDA